MTEAEIRRVVNEVLEEAGFNRLMHVLKREHNIRRGSHMKRAVISAGGLPIDAACILAAKDARVPAGRGLVAGSGLTAIDEGPGKYLHLSASGGGGAPVGAKYIVGAPHNDLTAEIVKAWLADNFCLDDYPGSPDAVDDEFNDLSIAAKWTVVNNPAPPNALSESAYPGSLWVGLTELTVSESFDTSVRLYQIPPAGNQVLGFIAKVSVASKVMSPLDSRYAGAGVYLGSSADGECVAALNYLTDTGIPTETRSSCVGFQTSSGNWSYFGSAEPSGVPAAAWVYVMLLKSTANAYTSENIYESYYSLNGILWHWTGKMSKAFANGCDECGIIFRRPQLWEYGTDAYAAAAVDFFRRID